MDGMICAYDKEHDACAGDSGGVMVQANTKVS
jgi:hypothetical protein